MTYGAAIFACEKEGRWQMCCQLLQEGVFLDVLLCLGGGSGWFRWF